MDELDKIGKLIADLYWVDGVSRVKITMRHDTIFLEWLQWSNSLGDWYAENMTYLFSQSELLITKLQDLRDGHR